MADASAPEGLCWGFDWVAQRMPCAIYRCAVDSELTMAALTERFATLTGFPVEALIANAERSFASLIHPLDRAAVIDAVREVGAREVPSEIEYRLLAADGRELWFRQEIWPSELSTTDGPRFVEGFLFDVTERMKRQRAEADRQLAYARQQRCLVGLATHPAVGGGQIDELSRLVTERVAELVDVERVSVWLLDARGEHLELVDLFVRSTASHSNDVSLSAGEYPNYFEALHSGRAIDAHDAYSDPRTAAFADHYLTPLGIVSMLDSAIRVAGKVAGVVCLEQVGPTRRWLQHEIDFTSEIADQLSLTLLNRARITAQAEQDELRTQLLQSQKMDALGRLAGGVAHDFNNVLMAISGNAELLVTALHDPLLHRSAQEIVDASVRAGELIGQLLRFARREPLELRVIELGAVVRELEDMLRRLLDKRLRFEVRVAAAPIRVRATETLIQQVLTNLVVNARDAVSVDGRITVEVDSIETLDGDQAKALARLRVSDDGEGMSPEVLARVFEPFFTTKPAGKGTGLGLATVYSIVTRCGGSVDIHSEPGRGATVTITLPIVSG